MRAAAGVEMPLVAIEMFVEAVRLDIRRRSDVAGSDVDTFGVQEVPELS
jgi:hypothetical protein